MPVLARSLLPVLHVLGGIVAVFAFTMLVPLTFAFFGTDRALKDYDIAFFITLAAGTLMLLAARPFRRELLPRDGFLLLTLIWTVLPGFAALPFLLNLPGLTFTDAYFEAMSGLTTTGATVLSNLDTLPRSINVWRHLLVWLGGMGIIVLAVAILPLLGVGGSQIYKTDSTGPLKEQKITPRVAETAKGLLAIYLAISLACVLAYRIAGMQWIDALLMMFSTMGLGAFTPHDGGVAFWNSPAIEATIAAFVLLAGINFSLHFIAFRKRSPRAYWRDSEVRAYLAVILGVALAVALFLWWRGVYPDFATALRYAAFNTISLATTSGYASTDYGQWPVLAPVLMLLLCAFCSCSGSTGSGIKMIRAIILVKQARREFVRILHPRVINPISVDGQVIENNVIFAVLAFMLIYGAALALCTFLLLGAGLDLVSAFSAAVACINNTGPGLNQVGPAANYAVLNDFETWVCAGAMLIGRLELMSVLVLLTPTFWRR